MSQNHPKIYTKPPNSAYAYGYKHKDLALLETRPRYWEKGRVKRRQSSLNVSPRLRTHWAKCRQTEKALVKKMKHWSRHFRSARLVQFLCWQHWKATRQEN